MATLIIHPDLDCKVYIDTELHGIAKAGEDYNISLGRGAYWIECISQENEADRTDFDFRTNGLAHTEHSKITLRSIRYKRLVSQYDYVGEFHCGFAKVKNNGKTVGYINRNGDVIYDENTYEQVLPFGDNTICVRHGRLWGILNSAGEYVIEPQFSSIKPLENGPAIFSIKNKYGLISTYSKIITPAKYDHLYKIDGANLIECRLNGKSGILNYEGNKITPLKYEEIYEYENGLAAVKLNNKWGFIDSEGEEQIIPQYDVLGRGFRNGIAIVGLCEDIYVSYGLINTKGEQITPLKYSKIYDWLHLGYAIVEFGGYWLEGIRYDGNKGVINSNGEEIVPPIYSEVSRIYNGMIRVNKDGKYGFYDQLGNMVIPAIYENADDEFHEGLVWVKKEGKYGYINKNGDEIIPMKYNYAKFFSEGLASVCLAGRWGVIDVTGKTIISFKYDDVGYFSENRATVLLDYKWGYVDKSANEVIPLIYDEADAFINGLAKVILNAEKFQINYKGIKAKDGWD